MQSYPVLCFNTASLREFVEFWSKVYGSPSVEKLYTDHISKKRFDADDILALYQWKNGTPLSERKRDSVETNIVAKLHIINELKLDYSEEAFQKNFKDMTAVWKIFLKNIISPSQFAIFDMHVFRAFWFLTTGEIREIDDVLTDAILNTHKERAKEDLYNIKYLPFIRSLMHDDIPLKKNDECLMMFGKFLRSEFSRALLPNSKSDK
ncbi:MAG: hypothetical protein COV45_05130 [Deltaproteobacteria bacterium CG11_big_fil_rev_8_21_14_0_20_47_16]|nr:MAG: hypothetical protein COV45_05130 [Deltaproteobacteria bacterium CG11_big_fil_rev_8_21_14_0_20_47_16]